MSAPTPRTDAVYLEHRHWANEDEATEAIEDFRDFARTLEHELNESRNAERLARVQLGAERASVRVLREACSHLSYVPRIQRALHKTEEPPPRV